MAAVVERNPESSPLIINPINRPELQQSKCLVRISTEREESVSMETVQDEVAGVRWENWGVVVTGVMFYDE